MPFQDLVSYRSKRTRRRPVVPRDRSEPRRLAIRGGTMAEKTEPMRLSDAEALIENVVRKQVPEVGRSGSGARRRAVAARGAPTGEAFISLPRFTCVEGASQAAAAKARGKSTWRKVSTA